MEIVKQNGSPLESGSRRTEPIDIPFSPNDHKRIIKLNTTVDVNRDTAYALLKFLKPRLRVKRLRAIRAAADDMDEAGATRTLGLLGYLTSTVEYHFRKAFSSKGEGFAFAAIPGLEDALTALGFRLGRNPRDDSFTAWINYPTYSWTGTDGELRFGAAVRKIDGELNQAADLLLPLRKGMVSLTESDAALQKATKHVTTCRTVMADLANNPFPDEFQAIRNFLIPLSVNGRRYEPPNATYASGWNRADVAIGNHDDRYIVQLDERIRHMASVDVAKISEERRLPSVTEIVARSTGTRSGFMSPDRIAGIANSLDRSEAEAVKAAVELAKAIAMLTGVHMGAIKKNLPENGNKEDVTHSASSGVSGRPITMTDELHDMRLHHPLTRAKLT